MFLEVAICILSVMTIVTISNTTENTILADKCSEYRKLDD